MKNPRRTTKRLLAGSAIAGALLGSAGVAMAQTGGSTTTTPSASSGTPRAERGAAQSGETPLSGDQAAKVTAAALAANPGATVVRVETDSDGSPYEAHIVKADGTRVTVTFDANFAVTGTEADQGGPGGGPGPRGKGGAGKGGAGAETPLTGDTAAKVTAAALAANPGATVERVETDSDGSPYEAHIVKADGTHATVKIDQSFAVTATESR